MKQIADYKDYFITEMGNVYSQKRDRCLKRLKVINNGCGYHYVRLYSDVGKSKAIYVHRLVAKAFIDNPENKKAINHKDGNKSNNLIENLEWVTYKENTHHASSVLGIKIGGPRPVIVTNINTNVKSKHHSILAAIRTLRLPIGTATHVAEVCRGELNHAGGYTWEYIHENKRT